MSYTTTTVYTCDNCGKFKEADKSYLSPEKWWQLYQDTEKGDEDKEFDLCSVECVVQKAHELRGF